MKILLIAILLVPVFAWANYVKKSEFKTPSKVYAKKAKCESQESQDCYDITGLDLRKWKVGFRAVNVENTVDCVDSDDCQAKLDADPAEFTCSENKTVATYDDKANWPGLDFTTTEPPRENTGWFLWCQKEQLMPDPDGEAAADAEDAQKAADQSARDNAKNQRLTDKDACVAAVNANPALTPQDIKDCLNILIKEVYEPEIPAEDL